MTSQQLQDRWDQVRRTYPVQTFERAGTTWRYRASGEGEHTLVVLPGALGSAGSYFVLMTELESRHRVLAVDIPDTASIREVTDGILDILNREGVERASFLGSSFGGMLVQAFAKSHPERVARLILSQTVSPAGIPPGKGRFWARIASVLPTGLIRWLFARLVSAMLKRTRQGVLAAVLLRRNQAHRPPGAGQSISADVRLRRVVRLDAEGQRRLERTGDHHALSKGRHGRQ